MAGGLVSGAIRFGQWVGRGLRTARGLIPKRWRGHDWTFMPLIPGKWRTLPPAEAMELMVRYAASFDRPPWGLREGRVLAVRVLPLICVEDGILVEYDLAGQYEEWRGLGAFVWRPNCFVPLEGQALPFHRMKDDRVLLRDTAERVLQFTQLFCASINGEDGSFAPMRRGFPLHVNTAHPLFPASVSRLGDAAKVTGEGSEWRVVMPIAYGSGFFISRFSMDYHTLIEMDDDDALYGLIPGAVPKWENGVRRLFAPDMEALSAMPGDEDEEQP
jgi:hypothetical protein